MSSDSVSAPAQQSTQPPTPPPGAAEPCTPKLLAEISGFRHDCANRYRFNNGWDIALTTMGILLSIAIIAAGFLKRAEISAILGAVTGAIVTAQKAFPFGQRASFYRLLIGQTDNLLTRASEGLWNRREVVDTLSTLRMDYAQQLPRGSSTPSEPASPALPHPGHLSSSSPASFPVVSSAHD